MFYQRYLWAELTRRWGKTLTISLGLAMASAIIIVIISVSQSLSAAQDKVLNPLQNVGTDIMVSRSVNAENMQIMDEATRTEMMIENQTSIDLSKLGNPGDQFVKDNFLPGTMLTFASDEMTKLDLSLVKESAAGLILNVVHQEGKIPQVTAEFKTGGEQIEVNQQISAMTDAEQAAVDAAREKVMADLKAKGIDPNSHEGHQYIRSATSAAMPERFRQFRASITTPERIYQQDVGPIATDIKTTNLTVAGVDTAKTDIGLILPNQIVSGTYFNGADQVIVSKSYADKNSLQLNGTIKLGNKNFTLVGIVEPQLYTNTADLYLPIADLQQLAGRDNRINVMLIKSTNAESVEATSQKLASAFTGAKVINAQDTAKEVSGSLVSAANLTNKFIGIASLVVIVAAFIIVSLLTILSVNKRVREIGTLKALGWSNTHIIRQIISENIVLGVIGALFGVGLALGAMAVLNHYNISLSATIGSSDIGLGMARRFFGGGRDATTGVTTTVPLKVVYTNTVILLGSLVALIGSMVAGALAAIKSSRMKPQEAFRNLE